MKFRLVEDVDSNSSFKERVEQIMMGDERNRASQMKTLIKNITTNLNRESILNQEDFNNLGLVGIKRKISDTLNNAPNGSWLMTNGTFNGYKYKDKWIWAPNLINYANGSLVTNVFKTAEYPQRYLDQLTYSIKKSNIHSVEILR